MEPSNSAEDSLSSTKTRLTAPPPRTWTLASWNTYISNYKWERKGNPRLLTPGSPCGILQPHHRFHRSPLHQINQLQPPRGPQFHLEDTRDPNSVSLLKSLSNLRLTQLVHGLTHSAGHILDPLFSSNNGISTTHLTPLTWSDHYIVHYRIPTRRATPGKTQCTITTLG